MASTAAAKVELDSFVLCVGCCGIFGATANYRMCLLRFGVNGSFFLLGKKATMCSLVQNLTSLRKSPMQVAYKFRTPNLYQCFDNVDTMVNFELSVSEL